MMLVGTSKVVALSLEIGTMECGACVFEGGGVNGALVSVRMVELGVGVVSDTRVADELVEGSRKLVVSEAGIDVSLLGIGVLVTAVGPEEMPVSVTIDEVAEPVSVGSEEVVVTPVPIVLDPEGVTPEVVVGTSVGLVLISVVGMVAVVSDVGMPTDVSEVGMGDPVVAPVPEGVPVGTVPVGRERMLDTSEMMLEITLETSGKDSVGLGVEVGSLEGSEVGIGVTVGAVGPSVGSLIPETVVGSRPVGVGSVGFKTDVTSDTTEDRTDDTSETTDDSKEDKFGSPTVSLVLSEVGITPVLVGVGVGTGVSLVPNAVVMPTTIPLVGNESGISDEKLISLEGSTTLLGIPPVEPADTEGVASTVSSSRLDWEVVGKIPVGKGSSPVRLDRISDGRIPVGKTDSPVGLEAALSVGKIPVGRMPVEPKIPLRDGINGDWVG